MKIKRYFAADIRQAIRMVRDEQGPDAVILSNRQVEGGIEIVAAVDYDESFIDDAVASPEFSRSSNAASSEGAFAKEPSQSLPHVTGQVSWHAPASPKTEEKVSPVDQAASEQPPTKTANQRERQVEWSQDPVLVSMKNELKDLRSLVESQLTGFAWGDMARQHPLQARVVRSLMEMGLSSEISKRIVAAIDEQRSFDDAWRLALTIMEQNISITEDDILTEGGIVALVGPTGVGKTTTIAKLAARYILRHGNDRVALITTDNYRIGAQEQLRTFGNILGAPVYVAKDYDELESTINSLQDKELVLIDTAGMSQRDVRLTEQLSMLRTALREVKTYLVLSATTQNQGLDEAVRAFKGVGLEGAILTKIDETVSLGEVLSTIMKYSLPIAYISDGQQVPEDLHPARSHNLVSRCVSMAQESQRNLSDEAVELEYGRMVVNANV